MRRGVILAILVSFLSLPLAAQKNEHQAGQGAIKGLVVNTQGQPVAGVKLEFQLDSGVKIDVETGENGDFLLDNVLPGTYTVTVSKEGYRTFHDQLAVDADVLTTYKVTIVTEAEAKEVRGGETWKQAQEAFKKGRYSEAETLFQQVIDQDPNYGNAVFNLGITQARLGKCRQALANLERAENLQYQPEGKVELTYLYAKAFCYEQLKQYDKAVEPYERLAEIAPQQFTLYLGNVYIRLKQYDKAKKAFEKFLRYSPNAPEAPQVRKVLEKIKQQES